MAVKHDDKLDRQLDAENGVLGSLLIDERILQEAFSVVDAGDFLNPTNRLIFQTARKLFQAGEPVDAMTIRDQIGGQYSNYLVQLMEITPTSANWREYAEAMHRQASLYRIKELAFKLEQAVTLEDCRPLCADLGQLLAGGQRVDAWTMREMLDDFFTAQDPDSPAPQYITSGIRELDEGSFTELGDVVMIGGYPSDGKTALALSMAYHMAKTHKVGFFSLETSKQKVRDRMVSHVAQISAQAIKRRALTEADWKLLAEKSADMVKRDLTVLRGAGTTVSEIQAISQAYGFQIIFIDYVQLVVPELDRRANRQEQMASVSIALHTFAQATGTLVVELAQLTRPERAGSWREPDMHDLKETGQFEQDADMIYLLFRPDPKDKTLSQDDHRMLKIAKNKEFRRGTWPLYFDGDKQTFSIMTDDKGVMRQMVEAGKAARARNRAEALGQQRIPQVTELPPTEAGNLPF
ncbi:AAA family ATPase [Dysosmobacter sp. NSJ-60]|nr:AAA family ATPase [Dysosmobacter hominis]